MCRCVYVYVVYAFTYGSYVRGVWGLQVCVHVLYVCAYTCSICGVCRYVFVCVVYVVCMCAYVHGTYGVRRCAE